MSNVGILRSGIDRSRSIGLGGRRKSRSGGIMVRGRSTAGEEVRENGRELRFIGSSGGSGRGRGEDVGEPGRRSIRGRRES